MHFDIWFLKVISFIWADDVMFEIYWSEALMIWTWARLTFGDGLVEPVFAWRETHDNQPKLFSILTQLSSSTHSNIGSGDELGLERLLSACSNQKLGLTMTNQSELGIMSRVLPGIDIMICPPLY